LGPSIYKKSANNPGDDLQPYQGKKLFVENPCHVAGWSKELPCEDEGPNNSNGSKPIDDPSTLSKPMLLYSLPENICIVASMLISLIEISDDLGSIGFIACAKNSRCLSCC
jgi:hypothetical protein